MDLEERARRVALGLLMLPNGATANIDPDRVNGGRDPSRPPAGESHPLVDKFAKEWAGALMEASRSACVEEAEQALEQFKRAPLRTAETQVFGSFSWKRMIAQTPEETSHGTLAQQWHCSRTYIARIRKEFARSSDA